MRSSLKYFVAVTTLFVSFACVSALAQTSQFANVGRTPTAEEIKAWDFAISLDGKELPPGSGNAQQGAPLFAAKCSGCHGKDLEGVRRMGPRLEGGKGTIHTKHPEKTIGSYWPFATSIWDYIHRAMPRYQEGTLSADQIYALTAFLLFKNGIIGENEMMNAQTLPKVQMPNRNGFVPARIEDIPDTVKRGCKFGICP
jgi:S-disulfanyl-L-cysteine oxidoreductase SoxD